MYALPHNSGETIELPPELYDTAGETQRQRMVEDPFADVLEGAFLERTGRVSMESVKLLLNLDPGRMYAGEAQRIRACMSALGWQYGTHRLHDLDGRRRSQRKGFAKGTAEERQTEWLSRRGEGGIVSLVEASGERDGDSPF